MTARSLVASQAGKVNVYSAGRATTISPGTSDGVVSRRTKLARLFSEKDQSSHSLPSTARSK
jgi:hypothetical protein